jgi:hypothetical protein
MYSGTAPAAEAWGADTTAAETPPPADKHAGRIFEHGREAEAAKHLHAAMCHIAKVKDTDHSAKGNWMKAARKVVIQQNAVHMFEKKNMPSEYKTKVVATEFPGDYLEYEPLPLDMEGSRGVSKAWLKNTQPQDLFQKRIAAKAQAADAGREQAFLARTHSAKSLATSTGNQRRDVARSVQRVRAAHPHQHSSSSFVGQRRTSVMAKQRPGDPAAAAAAEPSSNAMLLMMRSVSDAHAHHPSQSHQPDSRMGGSSKDFKDDFKDVSSICRGPGLGLTEGLSFKDFGPGTGRPFYQPSPGTRVVNGVSVTEHVGLDMALADGSDADVPLTSRGGGGGRGRGGGRPGGCIQNESIDMTGSLAWEHQRGSGYVRAAPCCKSRLMHSHKSAGQLSSSQRSNQFGVGQGQARGQGQRRGQGQGGGQAQRMQGSAWLSGSVRVRPPKAYRSQKPAPAVPMTTFAPKVRLSGPFPFPSPSPALPLPLPLPLPFPFPSPSPWPSLD